MVIGPTPGVIGQDSECLISSDASVKVQMCMCDCYKGIEKKLPYFAGAFSILYLNLVHHRNLRSTIPKFTVNLKANL